MVHSTIVFTPCSSLTYSRASFFVGKIGYCICAPFPTGASVTSGGDVHSGLVRVIHAFTLRPLCLVGLVINQCKGAFFWPTMNPSTILVFPGCLSYLAPDCYFHTSMFIHYPISITNPPLSHTTAIDHSSKLFCMAIAGTSQNTFSYCVFAVHVPWSLIRIV